MFYKSRFKPAYIYSSVTVFEYRRMEFNNLEATQEELSQRKLENPGLLHSMKYNDGSLYVSTTTIENMLAQMAVKYMRMKD